MFLVVLLLYFARRGFHNIARTDKVLLLCVYDAYNYQNPDYADGIWALVAVDLAKISGQSKRINITLLECLLSQMDQFAANRGETRSGLIAQATMEFIAAHREPSN